MKFDEDRNKIKLLIILNLKIREYFEIFSKDKKYIKKRVRFQKMINILIIHNNL
jgi:hypothetical protein